MGEREKHFLLPTQETGVDSKWWFLPIFFIAFELDHVV
jgi:hypothetical protein